MRLLVIDHFFDQDINAIRRALPADAELRTLSYEVLRDEALAEFPRDIVSGLESLSDPALDEARARYATRVAKLLEGQFAAFAFDGVVSPSDLFFYVRALPEACHALGVPFIVIQKET